MVVYECEKCKALFMNLGHFQNHIASSNACEINMKKINKCDECESRFTTKGALTLHKKKIHNNINKMKEEMEILQSPKQSNKPKGYESVYMAYLREFINSNQKIYKIGRTSQTVVERLKGYPKGSLMIQFCNVENNILIEKEIKEHFSVKFKQRTDIGLEYYEGELKDMIKEFQKILYEKNK